MERRVNGTGYYQADRDNGIASSSTPPPKYPSTAAAGSDAVGVGVGGGGLNYIEHTVSKFDTLAGVAIRYGVEVADIKKMNGLVTDLQMFALKTLQIPLPGRHPPSPILSNGVDTNGSNCSEHTTSSRRHSDLFDSFQSLKLKASPRRKVSPAMSSLQGYYGLKPADQRSRHEGFEMAVYRKSGARYLEDGPFSRPLSEPSNPPLSHHRKCKSVANGLLSENGDLSYDSPAEEANDNGSDNWIEKLLRRHQKSNADLHSPTPVKILKDESNNGGGFSAITGKGLALRPKSVSRAVSGADTEASLLNPIVPIGLGDSFVADNGNGVRKSSSTPSFQESESDTFSSIWPTTKWSLKQELQALSAAAIARPIFDGLPKPITGRKNKAALD